MVANNLKQIGFILISILLTITLLGCTSSKSVEIYIINELQECEEENIHYRIVDSKELNLQKKFDEIILPELSNELVTKDNFNLLWPSETKRRMKLKVKGYFKSSGKYNSYGCVGSRVFVIEEIIDVEDVTESMNYVISN